ncbi:MAG TPA: GntR family transcriptional regulator, partial [Casimicrobiaceae bacterium]|nr:GntR family transcriptional regulator [Casimicrobiaceae bacterium]
YTNARMPASPTLSHSISQQLAAEIIGRELAPGTRLDEVSLAARFGVSRSPVRDALRQLSATRLVAYAPHRGFSVVAIDRAELGGLFEASGEVEALCARLCTQRALPAERKRIQMIHASAAKALTSRNVKVYASLNEEFHQAIFAAAHNETLAEVAKNLRQRLAPFRGRLFFVSRNRMARSHDEHDALVAAIVAQDADAAAHAMREHGAHSAMNALERMRGEAPAMAPL